MTEPDWVPSRLPVRRKEHAQLNNALTRAEPWPLPRAGTMSRLKVTAAAALHQGRIAAKIRIGLESNGFFHPQGFREHLRGARLAHHPGNGRAPAPCGA